MPLPETVFNLKVNSSSERPAFGRLEFFLNLRGKEFEPLIQKQQRKIIDLFQRTLEQVSWDELESPLGKEKLRKILRSKVNKYLEQDIVLGIYYRSVILSK